NTRAVQRSEAQRVEHCDGSCAHGEHVAQDSANTGCSSLVWLHRRRVVVRLDLERDGKTITDGNDAGVLTRSLKHPGRLGGEGAQHWPGVLVGAVLVPESRNDTQFSERGCAPEHVQEQVVLVRREAMLGNEFGSDFRIAGPGIY